MPKTIRNPEDVGRVRAFLAAKIRLATPLMEAERNVVEKAKLRAIIDTYCELYRDLVGREHDK